jgi:nucleotide-binding universal stress UspA family protein
VKLLIAYDGSECAKAAMSDLVRAGLPRDCEAVVLSVADVCVGLPPTGPESIPVSVAAMVEKARATAAAAVAESRRLAEDGATQIRSLFPNWRVVADAAADSPYWAFIRRAEEMDADLIVVGSHGRSLLGRAVLGSVSQKVLHHARSSVRIGRNPPPPPEGTHPPRLVVGVDGSAGSQAAVDEIARRNWPAGTAVHVISVPDLRGLMQMASDLTMIPVWIPQIAGAAADEHAVARGLVEAAGKKLAAAGLAVSTAVREGDPKHALLQEAESWNADTIFVGAKGHSRLERFLIGSVSAAVAARARCTVEIVRPKE